MAKMIIWTPEQASKELGKRLAYAKQQRKPLDKEWSENDATLFNVSGEKAKYTGEFNWSTEQNITDGDPEQTNADMGINYTFKNFRFIHSQMCANPPSVVPRPTSPDLSDRRKADAADRLIRHGMRQYNIKETVDKTTFNCLRHGTAFVKTTWDTEAGEPLHFDPETQEIVMEGDICIRPVSVKAMYLDSNATRWEDVVYVFEEIVMPYEEACYRFPKAKEALEKERMKQSGVQLANAGDGNVNQTFKSPFEVAPYDVIRIYEYWEKGTPYNGMVGRHVFLLNDGTLVSDLAPNPYRFSSPKDRGLGDPEQSLYPSQEGPETACLPYHPLNDIDVGDSVYARSMIAYAAPVQAWYNRVLTAILDNVQVHGVARILLPEGTEIDEDSISNTPTDIIRYTGAQPPSYMEPMPLPAGMTELMTYARQGIDDLQGVNESMFGQQSRETSGFSMQYATNQGNMIRRRLFDNYVGLVESVYHGYLKLIRKHWKTPRKIAVLGKEKAFEATDLQGMDISGGYDLVVEYGTSLSLDPVSRRQELLQLEPLMEKAEQSATARRILSMLRLNELDSYIDGEQMAYDRQREIFEEMISTDTFIPLGEQEDDEKMQEFAIRYRMSAEFKYLLPEHQILVLQHMKERAGRIAQVAQAAAPQAPGAGGPILPAQGSAGGAGPVDPAQGGAQASPTPAPQV